MVAPNPELEHILRQVRSWPIANRLTLARRVLEMIDEEATFPPPTTKGPAAHEILGMLNPTGSAPDDEECRRILEEELLRKHAS